MLARMFAAMVVAVLLAGCTLFSDADSLTARDSGRVELVGGDWVTSGFEILRDGATVKVEVEATGEGVDVGVIHLHDYDSWANDDPEVYLHCAVFSTRLFEQSCPFDQGEYLLTIWNPHDTRSMVVWSWEVPPLRA